MLDATGASLVVGTVPVVAPLNTVELRQEAERALVRMTARLENWARWSHLDTGIPACKVSLRQISTEPEPDARDAMAMDRALAAMRARRAYYWRIVDLSYRRGHCDVSVAQALRMGKSTLRQHRRQVLSWLICYFDSRGDVHA